MACSACEKLMHRLCSDSTASAAGTRICTACSEAAKTHALHRPHCSRMMSDKAAAAWAFSVPDPKPLPAAGDADRTDSSSVNITSISCLKGTGCGGLGHGQLWWSYRQGAGVHPGFLRARAAAQPKLHIRSPTPGRGHHFSLKSRYRLLLIKRLLTFHNLPMPEQDRLKNEAKKKQRGTCGLDHGCKAHVLDAMVMAKQASMKIESARNCWRKTGLLEGKPGGAGAFDSKCRRWRPQP